MTVQPQSLAGVVCAIEGIRGAVALLHGSTGCKFYLSSLVENLDPREGLRSPMTGGVFRLYGQSRVPCTDIWSEDLVFGGEVKLERALAALDGAESDDGPGLIAVVTTTPLTVIGDDVRGLLRAHLRRARAIHVDGGGLLGDAADGYARALRALVKEVMRPDSPRRPGTVNLLGLSILQPRWEDDIAELRRMLAGLGVEVNSVLTAGATLDEVERAPAAELNVVVQPEYGAGVAREMRRTFGQAAVGLDGYAPYGLPATEAWLRRVGEALGLPSARVDAALATETAAVRRRIASPLAVLDRTNPLKGRSVAVFGEAGPAVALASFLVEYLGLHLALLGLKSGGLVAEAQLRRLEEDLGPVPRVLREPSLTAVREALAEIRPDLILGSSFERSAARDAGLSPDHFVDFGYPLWHRIVVAERPFVGYRGTLTLVEDILNAAVAL
ncbi:MAG: nitrogenase component 1 [Chloroflexi bacterium]|nr:nitrogenase component 1 [Chloroflexota bacterium]